MKFCKDCAHFKLPFKGAELSIGLCSRKDADADPVTGFPSSDLPHPFCKVERMNQIGFCGSDARFFEPKEVPNV